MPASLKRCLIHAAAVVAVVTITAGAALAQTITGNVIGTVTDPSGAVVAGAKVTATNVGTNVATDTTTNHDGLYNIRFLPIGSYTITASAPGFTTTSTQQFALEIDQTAKVDAKLQLGNATATVNVSSDVAPILQTQDATLGSTIASSTLSNLPMNGLNFQTATLFVPGAVNPSLSSMAATDGNERNIDWYGTPSFNGNRAQTNNYVLDGVEINETINNLASYNPAPDAIQQMRVITGNANAEYGNVNGGEELIITKGGSNQIHGSAYDYFQNNNFSATSWSNSYNGLPSTPFTQNQFGVTAGGPILKNKLFIFGDYLGFRYHSGGQGVATVATADMRNGDFSELLGGQFGNIQLYNNQHGQGFANATKYINNQIPILNPVAQYLFAHPAIYPLPNRAPITQYGLGDTSNYAGPVRGQTQNNQGDVRVDYTIGSRDTLMGRYTNGDAHDFQPAALQVTFPTTDDYPFQSFVTNWVHTFSPAVVNEFRAGFTRTVFDEGVPGDPTGLFGTAGNSVVGLPFPNQTYAGFSQMYFGLYRETAVGTQAIVTQFHENNFYYADNLTWQHGRHAFKFGAQILRYQQNAYYAGNSGAMGQFDYDGQYTANGLVTPTPNGPNAPGYDFADFVLNQSAGASVGGVSGADGQRQYRNAYYAQDDWRILPSLTLNLGVRYGHDQPIYEVHNKEASVDLSNLNDVSASGIIFAGKNGASRALYNPYYGGVMPRVGFAFQASPRLVVRGAYGITDDLEGTGLNLRMTQNAPFQSSFVAAPTPPTQTSSGLTPLPIQNGFNLAPSAIQVSYFNYNAWDPNIKPSVIQQFNLTTEYMIDNKTSAQVGYVGMLGHHLMVPVEANQFFTSASGVLADGDCSGVIAPAAPACNLVGNSGNLQVTKSEGYSNYHALQTTIRRQFSQGLEFTFNYTYSRAMTNNAGFYGVADVNEGSSFYQDFRNPAGDYGPAGQDTRNAFNGYFTYELPFGHGRKFGTNVNRAVDEAIGGWKVSGSVVMYSGFPVTMSSPENYYVNSFAAHAQYFRPMHHIHRTTQNWFGTDPSAVPCTSFDKNGNTIDNGTCAYGVESFNGFGNAQNGSERAPGFRQVDLAASKLFHITETHTLELRGEGFNALNIASYGPPNNSLNAAQTNTFGLINATNSSQRIMQISAHYRF